MSASGALAGPRGRQYTIQDEQLAPGEGFQTSGGPRCSRSKRYLQTGPGFGEVLRGVRGFSEVLASQCWGRKQLWLKRRAPPDEPRAGPAVRRMARLSTPSVAALALAALALAACPGEAGAAPGAFLQRAAERPGPPVSQGKDEVDVQAADTNEVDAANVSAAMAGLAAAARGDTGYHCCDGGPFQCCNGGVCCYCCKDDA